MDEEYEKHTGDRSHRHSAGNDLGGNTGLCGKLLEIGGADDGGERDQRAGDSECQGVEPHFAVVLVEVSEGDACEVVRGDHDEGADIQLDAIATVLVVKLLPYRTQVAERGSGGDDDAYIN